MQLPLSYTYSFSLVCLFAVSACADSFGLSEKEAAVLSEARAVLAEQLDQPGVEAANPANPARWLRRWGGEKSSGRVCERLQDTALDFGKYDLSSDASFITQARTIDRTFCFF